MHGRSMVVTDLDGTLFQSNHRVSPRNLRTLEELGRDGVLRAIATGRNLYSARKALPEDFPVDYLLFSSGAGVMEWPGQRLLRAISMDPHQARRAFAVLAERGVDFMLHRPIPESHRFLYYKRGLRQNPDFEARLIVYAQFAVAGDIARLPDEPACQLVVVEPPEVQPSAYESLRAELSGFTVIRTTSPLDGCSRWIEIFPPQVSKSQAAAWLARERQVQPDGILAVGNDYNDLDLLQWASKACLVGGCSVELLGRFPLVSRGEEADFAEAVEDWRKQRHADAGRRRGAL
jgi:hydroxymethylpyrimidine pyrophosphatase-like HAD family hydrolase